MFGVIVQEDILTTTLRLTLKMTTAQVVETSVTNNYSLSQGYPHPEDHDKQISLNNNRIGPRKLTAKSFNITTVNLLLHSAK